MTPAPPRAYGTAELELQLSLLSHVASALARDLDPERMRGHALRAAVSGTHSQRGIVLLHDRTANVFWGTEPAIGWSDGEALALSVGAGECPAVDSIYSGELATFAYASPGGGVVPALFGRAGAKTGLIVPLWSGKDIVGVMCLMDKHEAFGDYADSDASFARTIIMQLSAGLRTARLRDYGGRRGAGKVSVLFARGDFDEIVGMEIDRAERLGHTIGCAVFEIADVEDALKRHGPAAIDATVKAIAQAVHEHMRQTDILIRYDESTVVLIMPGTDADGCRVVVTRLEERLRAFHVRCGVCAYPEGAISASELVSAALRSASSPAT
jgi:GGDEF domain-containing protein